MIPDFSVFHLVLDEEFIKKRQNRNIMEKKQPRDKNGRFASNDAAVKSKKSTKKIGKARRGNLCIGNPIVDWQAEYDKKVIELRNKDDDYKAACEAADKYKELLDKANKANILLDEELKLKQSIYGYYEKKSKVYLHTAKLQNEFIKELESQLDWLMSNTSLFARLFKFKTIKKMYHNRLRHKIDVWRSKLDW